MRALQIAALAGLISQGVLCQEAATLPGGAPLAFEVATIKPAVPPAATGGKMMFRFGVTNDGALVNYSHMTLKSLVQAAYGVKDYQVIAAGWMDAAPFDIAAKLPDGATKDQAPEMLQTLLKERFKLTLHREQRDHAVYALVVGKSGPKLTVAESAAAPGGAMAAPEPGKPPAPAAPPKPSGDGVSMPMTFSTGRMTDLAAAGRGAAGGRGGPGNTSMSMGPNGGHIDAKATTLPRFAETMSRFLDRPVVDETGIAGAYDFSLDISRDEMGGAMMGVEGARKAAMAAGGPNGAGRGGADAPAGAPDGGGSIFQSIQQYGLKLEAKKAPMDAIVIDGAEKAPTEN